MKQKTFFLILASITTILVFTQMTTSHIWNNDTPIEDVMLALGKEKPLHFIQNLNQKRVKQGEEIVTKGRTRDDRGKKSSWQSKFFLCTDCHTTSPEYFYDGIFTAEARLKNAKSNNTPYLAGSSFYGTVNKKSWYNGDYVKKYGSLAENAHDTLVNAIQLCATECSQGRALEDWEMEAVLSYFWSIQLKMGDLHLDEDEWAIINSSDRKAGLATINKHLQEKPNITFLTPTPIHDRKMGIEGNVSNGEYIYKNGCLHCHSRKSDATTFKLDDNKLSYKFLQGYLKKYSSKSIYNIIRDGTHPIKGHKPYMPLYPEEKMSKEQVEDLAAYINQMAEQ